MAIDLWHLGSNSGLVMSEECFIALIIITIFVLSYTTVHHKDIFHISTVEWWVSLINHIFGLAKVALVTHIQRGV